MPCSVLLCRRPQLEYFQSVATLPHPLPMPVAPAKCKCMFLQVPFAFSSVSQCQPYQPKVQKCKNCTFVLLHIRFVLTTPSFLPTHASHTAESAKLHFCIFDLRQPHHPCFAHASRTSRKCKNANALLHILLVPTTTSLDCPCQPY